MVQILFIAEAALFRETMEYCLPRLGHAVVTAENEESAHAAAAAQPPDVVMLDVDLSVGSGLRLCERLSRDPRFSGVPIVALTAVITPEVSARVLAAGAAGLVAKPFQWEVLLGLVERLASRRRPAPMFFPVACRGGSPPSCSGREDPDGGR